MVHPSNISYWQKRIGDHKNMIQFLQENDEFLDMLNKVANVIVDMYKNDGKLFVCGNGGSAADSQHAVCELVGRFLKERKPIRAEALTVNTSTLTAIANDYGYEHIFSRQIEANGKKGDALIGISTSGNSPNVILALNKAREMGLVTIGLAGGNRQSKIFAASDYCLWVPSSCAPRVQEGHSLIIHLLCEYIEETLFFSQS